MFPWHERQSSPVERKEGGITVEGITKGEREERCDQGLLAATCKMVVHRVAEILEES